MMMKDDYWRGVFVGFALFGLINMMPFSDAEKYRRAVEQCERTLPRDQQRVVVGVKV